MTFISQQICTFPCPCEEMEVMLLADASLAGSLEHGCRQGCLLSSKAINVPRYWKLIKKLLTSFQGQTQGHSSVRVTAWYP